MTSISDNRRVLVYSQMDDNRRLRVINTFLLLEWRWDMTSQRLIVTSPGGDQVVIAHIETLDDAKRFAGLRLDGVVSLDGAEGSEEIYQYLRALVRPGASGVSVSIR